MSLHITKNKIRATGADANALLNALVNKNKPEVKGWHYERSEAGNGYCVKNGNFRICFVHYGEDHQNMDRADRIVEAMKKYDPANQTMTDEQA
jgi:dTDP-4-dehydrorhamnose 3,5-epimerase-like enzyme